MSDQEPLLANLYLGIVCPMANEEETVAAFVPEVLSHCGGFKRVTFFPVLDNKSTDSTARLLQELQGRYPQISTVWAPENRCVVDAYLRGYREALKAGCDWILEIDAGYSHQPGDIPPFFEKIPQGYDCVFGSRFCRGGQMEKRPLGRYLVSRGGTIMANLLLGTRLHDMTSGFELFSRRALESVLEKGIQSRAHFFQTEIKFHCRQMRIIEVPIRYSNPSPSVTTGVLGDALSNLLRLWKLRIKGTTPP